MKPELLEQDQADAIVNERIDSHEWWVFVGPSAGLCVIEETFYSGEANADFHVLIGPPTGYFKDAFSGGLLPLTFAHKRRMTAEQLHGLLSQYGNDEVSIEHLRNHDILLCQ